MHYISLDFVETKKYGDVEHVFSVISKIYITIAMVASNLITNLQEL